ncbi:creatine kinase B-type-like [Monodelphis domestica]|uniref:creatine kinase B-type-like n=1 Tax=Monodelphis domestica TaxID=13616 RepID=UPI0024E1FD5D|nr:creatine kinase B-type-like [Monodelphis domestica]
MTWERSSNSSRSQHPLILILILTLSATLAAALPLGIMPFSSSHMLKSCSAAEEKNPDLHLHNHITKVLTPELYEKLRDKFTPSGFTLDDAIQIGVDNPGNSFVITMGSVAGNEENFDVLLKEGFDPIIKDRLGGYKPSDEHKMDLNADDLQDGDDLDPNYVLISPGRTGRNIRGFCLPPHCSQRESCAIEKLSGEDLASLVSELNTV